MNRISRRRFSLGLGAGLLAAPLLGLLHGTGRADGAKFAKRLVVFFSPNGTIHEFWRPKGSGANFSFEQGTILEALEKHKSSLLVCDGLDFKGADNHDPGMAAMLTGGGAAGHESKGMSVDQFVAAQIGQNDRFQSLEFGVQTSAWGGNVSTRMSYLGPGIFAPPDDDPKSVYKRLFGDAGATDDAKAKALSRRKGILDVLRGELAELEGRVGDEEHKKLEEHVAALKKVELGLTAPEQCDAPTKFGQNVWANDNFPAVGQAQTDLLVLALACGMTRVASIQWSHTISPTVFSWLGLGEGHHSLSHSSDNSAGVPQFVQSERWYAEQFVYLLDKLAATPDPAGGTLLDSTLVVWAKEMGDSRLHVCKSVPFVLTGGGYFKPGQYLDFAGESHTKLLVSICHAMGLSNQSFGDPAKGTGPLAGLT